MPDRMMVINALKQCISANKTCAECPYEGTDCTTTLNSDALSLLKDQQEIVRCKDCVYNGKIEKCVLAAIAAEKGYPLFMLDNRGEWYCADGKRR